jgi:ABC-type transport system involved in multi-copper enzyme maturation permease subunit
MSFPAPSTGTALVTLGRLTFTRLLRGKLMWVSLAIACLPAVLAAALAKQHDVSVVGPVFKTLLGVMAILPPMFAAPAIGEEIEDRTASYLWSRPLRRWTILAGKLLALAPLSMALLAGSWGLAIVAGAHAPDAPPAPMTVAAVAAGAFGVSILSAGIATLAPKRGMALAIIYVLIVDLPLGVIPASVQWVSVTHAVSTLAGFEHASRLSGGVALFILCAIWAMVSFRRISRIEA